MTYGSTIAQMQAALRHLADDAARNGELSRKEMGRIEAHMTLINYLASTPAAQWTVGEQEVAWYLCCFHRKQLAEYQFPAARPKNYRAWELALSRAEAAQDQYHSVRLTSAPYYAEFLSVRGEVLASVPLADLSDADLNTVSPLFTLEELAQAREFAHGVTLSYFPRIRSNTTHFTCDSLYLQAVPSVFASLTQAQREALLTLPCSSFIEERHCYAVHPLALTEALDVLSGAGLLWTNTVDELCTLYQLEEQYGQRYQLPCVPHRPNLYKGPSYLTGVPVLLVYGPYNAERIKFSARLSGQWTGEAHEFPLSSYPAVRAMVEHFGGSCHLSDEEIYDCQMVAAGQGEALKREQEMLAQNIQVYPVALLDGTPAIYFDFPYNPQLKDLIATRCPVKFYDLTKAARKGWYAKPSDLLRVLEAAELAELRPSPELTKQVDAAQTREQQRHANAERALKLREKNIHGKAVSSPALPGLKTPLMHHQTLLAPLVPLTGGVLLLADEQGLGKTLEAIAVMLSERKPGYRAAVICPSNLSANWQAEFEAHAPGVFRTAVLEGETPYAVPDEVEVVIIGWAVLSHWQGALEALKLTRLVIDEGQMGKAGGGEWGSSRGEAMLALSRSVRTAGGSVLVMTGTPVDARPLDLLPLLQALGVEEQFGGEWKFKQRYCGPKEVFTGSRKVLTYQGATNTKELHGLLHAQPWYVRRTKRLLVERGEMQPKYVNGREWYDYAAPESPQMVTLPPDAWEEYEEAVLNFQTYLARLIRKEYPYIDFSGAGQSVLEDLVRQKMRNILPKLGILREVVGRLKQPAVIARVRELNSQGEQVVVIAHHRKVVTAYAKALCPKGKPLKIQGGMGTEEIEAAKLFFNTHGVQEAPNLILSVEAGKLGHTLCLQRKLAGLPECARVVIAEEIYNPGTEAQAVDRVWRIPQTRPVYAENVLARDTIDEGLYHLRRAKRNAMTVITDGEAIDGDADLSGILSVWLHGFNLLDALMNEDLEGDTEDWQ